jgi:CheY-like chemotaxis protein
MPLGTLREDCAQLLHGAEHAGRCDLQRIHDATQQLCTTLDELRGPQHAGPEGLPEVFPEVLVDERGRASQKAFAHDLAHRKNTAVTARVLVVDDQQSNRDLLSCWLERQQHEVLLAADGAAALDLVMRHPCDLVLLDMMMPGMSGIEVLQRMKSDAVLREVPVIVISALNDLDSIVRCIALGAEDYLPKPFEPLLLRARVEYSLEKKRLRDQELAYLRCVAQVTTAATAVEQRQFTPTMLEDVAERTDALGRLARVFCKMANEVKAREQRLAQQVRDLRIEIDESRRAKQVNEITDTDYFRQLQVKARALARRT